VNVEDVTVPTNIDNYCLITKQPANSFFYGSIIKNKLDEERIYISEKFNPKKYYVVTRKNNDFSIQYLYGSFFPIEESFISLITNLNNFVIIDNKFNLSNYNNILKYYNIDCEDNFGYFCKGLLPISGKYIFNLLKDKSFDNNNFYLTKNDVPFYLSIASPHIFFLSGIDNNIADFQKKFVSKKIKFNFIPNNNFVVGI